MSCRYLLYRHMRARDKFGLQAYDCFPAVSDRCRVSYLKASFCMSVMRLAKLPRLDKTLSCRASTHLVPTNAIRPQCSQRVVVSTSTLYLKANRNTRGLS